MLKIKIYRKLPVPSTNQYSKLITAGKKYSPLQVEMVQEVI